MALIIDISPAGDLISIMSEIRLTSSSLTTVVFSLFFSLTFSIGEETRVIGGDVVWLLEKVCSLTMVSG